MNTKRVENKIKSYVIHGKTYITIRGEIHALYRGRWTPIDKIRTDGYSIYKDFSK